MKNKILSIALIMGMMLSLLSITPVSASDTTVADGLPYFFNDFEDGKAIFSGSNISVVDGGVGGSGKAMKITEGNTDTCPDYHLRNSLGSQLSGTIPAGATVKVSFWLKNSTPLTQCDFSIISFDIASKIDYPKGTGDKNSTEWQKVEFEFTTSDDATFNSMMFRTGNVGLNCNPVVGGSASAPGSRTYLIDDFEMAVYKKGLIKSEYYTTLHNYYVGFENGAGPLCIMVNNVGYPVAQSTAITNGSSTMQVVNNPSGAGKVLKYDMISSARGDDQFLRMAKNTGTGDWAGYDYMLSGSVPAGSTITYTFKYYWAQEMTMANNPGFCIYDGVGQYATGSDFSGTAGVWHTATLTYTNSGTSATSVSWPQLRFCPQNAPGGTWTVAAGNHAGFVNGGTSDFGNRTIYLDDISIKITPNTDAPDAQAPETSGLSMTGDFATGNEVSFSQNFSSGTATDESIVKLVNEDASGKKGTLAYADINGTMTIPSIPEGGTLSFIVVPIDSEGAVGVATSYSYVAVVGFVSSLELSEFAADGSITAKVNMENMKRDQSSANAVLVVLMYDANGAMVKYDAKGIVCPYNGAISGDTAEGMLTVTGVLEAATAEAYLWDCGTSALPTFKNTTMKEIAADITVSK